MKEERMPRLWYPFFFQYIKEVMRMFLIQERCSKQIYFMNLFCYKCKKNENIEKNEKNFKIMLTFYEIVV